MRETSNSFFIGDAPRGSVAALPDKAGGRELSRSILQRIALANTSLEQATARLIRLAEIAHDARRNEELKAISEALQAIPFAPAQRAGNYYSAVLAMRAGQLDRATDLLSDLHAPRALLTLGTVEEYRGNFDEAARLHIEAMRAGRSLDPFAFAGAALQLATIRSMEGDHAGSLQAFQHVTPFVRAIARAYPSLSLVLHNAAAVELNELGRVEEARAALAVAFASPVADRYPEIRETAREIAEASPARAAVAVVEPQLEDTDATEARPVIWRISPDRPRHLFLIQPYARTLLNPRASPRAPPSVF